jgi:hypothetical protein
MVSDTTPLRTNTIVQWNEKSRRVGIVIVAGERRIAQQRRFRLGGTDGKHHGALAGALQKIAAVSGCLIGIAKPIGSR